MAGDLKVKVFINGFNRLATLRDMVAHIQRMRSLDEIVIIDNGSNYPPLKRYLETECPCRVVMLGDNLGHRAPWTSGVVRNQASEYYVVTDPDLDLKGIPEDCLEHLVKGLERYPDRNKCGLGIEIRDIPKNTPTLQAVHSHEMGMWSRPLDAEYFDATCDTTFAVYHRDRTAEWPNEMFIRGTRCNYPYVCRHVPWYTDNRNLSDEDYWYFRHCHAGACGWSWLKARELGLR